MTITAEDRSQRNHDTSGVSRQRRDVTARLARAAGQIHGVVRMYESGRPAVEVLDQLGAVVAAVDEAALLILTDYMHATVQHAPETVGTETCADEIATVVRRYVRRG